MFRERVGRFFNRVRNEVMICGPKVARHEDTSASAVGLGHGSGNIWLGTGHQGDRRGRKDARQVEPTLFCNLRMSSINVELLSRNIKSFSKRGIDYQDKADMILIYEEAKT
ncbi:hypothetical protein ALC57_11785 [Trachymyrmex cornetzi]|uniref:Uncharacterized protein n=1 Tax=Trachymyrmex cornetzi TaxID=471704 RepID=A0A151J245_9HYME|nr:hypothetical protein ALC57_11785 [Trachymyrmex cornetzi]